jgi:hypothetical protein
VTQEDTVIRRIRVRAAWIGGILSAGAFLFGWKRGVSLTICAAVVIFSFLVFERLTGRLVEPAGRRIQKLLPPLLVTAAAVALLIAVLRWKAFDPVAGAVGMSVVVLAIGAEVFEKKE